MNTEASPLEQKSLLIIFTYALDGLGHLRVTDALYHGLSKDSKPIFLQADDTAITMLHRFASVHPISRQIMEMVQSPLLEKITVPLYRKFLHSRSEKLYKDLEKILKAQSSPIKTLLFISTHFGLAHQMGRLKKRIEQNFGIKVLLVLQVTDDSPQFIWYVEEADAIFVPSYTTKNKLQAYGRQARLAEVRFEVVPYPISPTLGKMLPESLLENRVDQLNPEKQTPINIMIPISGAAVGLRFFQDLMQLAHTASGRFFFYVVCRKSVYTSMFLEKISKLPYVKTYGFEKDHEVVGSYESVYRNVPISLEITKPSEQAFKVLYTPKQHGGSILLFSDPVGRQEHDNVYFLMRHNLIPQFDFQTMLWRLSYKGLPLQPPEKDKILALAAGWRGMRLPKNPKNSVRFISWALREGIFAAMMEYQLKPKDYDPHKDEMGSDGVSKFWTTVSKIF